MIKCSLIEVDNDNRAIICVGGVNVGDTDGEVRRTPRIEWIDYASGGFKANGQIYDFSN